MIRSIVVLTWDLNSLHGITSNFRERANTLIFCDVCPFLCPDGMGVVAFLEAIDDMAQQESRKDAEGANAKDAKT